MAYVLCQSTLSDYRHQAVAQRLRREIHEMWVVWDIKKRVVVIPYRRFGSNLSATSSRNPQVPFSKRWDRQTVPRGRYGITTIRCVTSQKNTGTNDLKTRNLDFVMGEVCVLMATQRGNFRTADLS